MKRTIFLIIIVLYMCFPATEAEDTKLQSAEAYEFDRRLKDDPCVPVHLAEGDTKEISCFPSATKEKNFKEMSHGRNVEFEWMHQYISYKRAIPNNDVLIILNVTTMDSGPLECRAFVRPKPGNIDESLVKVFERYILVVKFPSFLFRGTILYSPLTNCDTKSSKFQILANEIIKNACNGFDEKCNARITPRCRNNELIFNIKTQKFKPLKSIVESYDRLSWQGEASRLHDRARDVIQQFLQNIKHGNNYGVHIKAQATLQSVPTCPKGYSFEKPAICIPCGPGTYSPRGITCLACPASQYQPMYSSSYCKFCPPGSPLKYTGASTIEECYSDLSEKTLNTPDSCTYWKPFVDKKETAHRKRVVLEAEKHATNNGAVQNPASLQHIHRSKRTALLYGEVIDNPEIQDPDVSIAKGMEDDMDDEELANFKKMPYDYQISVRGYYEMLQRHHSKLPTLQYTKTVADMRGPKELSSALKKQKSLLSRLLKKKAKAETTTPDLVDLEDDGLKNPSVNKSAPNTQQPQKELPKTGNAKIPSVPQQTGQTISQPQPQPQPQAQPQPHPQAQPKPQPQPQLQVQPQPQPQAQPQPQPQVQPQPRPQPQPQAQPQPQPQAQPQPQPQVQPQPQLQVQPQPQPQPQPQAQPQPKPQSTGEIQNPENPTNVPVETWGLQDVLSAKEAVLNDQPEATNPGVVVYRLRVR